MRQILFYILLVFNSAIWAQNEAVYEKVAIDNSLHISASVVNHPTNNDLALISTTQGHPLQVFNWKERKIVRKHDIDGFYAGPNVDWSNNAKYWLLEQKFYHDFSLNKDRKVEYRLLDANTSQELKRLEGVHDACFSADGDKLFVLKEGEVKVMDCASQKIENKFKVREGATAICRGKLNNEVYISHSPNNNELDAIPSVSPDKKQRKNVLKYRQVISTYNVKTGKITSTIQEVYDIVYDIRNLDDHLFIYNAPHDKIGGGEGYINQVNLVNNEALYASFQSSFREPDFALSPDGKYLAVVSVNRNRSLPGPLIILYDRETGAIVNNFSPHVSLAQNIKDKEYTDGRSYLEFDKSRELLYVIYGNRIFEWQYLK